MANPNQLKTYINFTDLNTTYAFQSDTDETMTGQNSDRVFFTWPTSVTEWEWSGGVATVNYLYARNYGANILTFSLRTGVPYEFLIYPGTAILVPLAPSATKIFIIAVGGASDGEFWVRQP